MNQAVEMNQALRYKQRMFGDRLTGPACVCCDNKAVYNNVSILESVLN